jgi:hypothetical protein
MDINDLTGQVIGAAIEVHKVLGPGLLESAYEVCLCVELDKRKKSLCDLCALERSPAKRDASTRGEKSADQKCPSSNLYN